MAGGSAGESAEVGHDSVLKQERVPVPGCGVRLADDLAVPVDACSAAEVAAGGSAEVDHDPAFKQKSMGFKKKVGGRIADNLAVVVDAPGDAEDAIGESAQILDGKALAGGRLQCGGA